jgi:HAD superfamily hydrolase (TIGR01490 family)
VFFDLDGTITRHDSFIPYVLYLLRAHPARAWRSPLLLPWLFATAVGWIDRGALKGAVMRLLLRDLTRAQIEMANRRFVERLVARGMFRGALEAIDAHQAAGDRLVLMSASPALYVPSIAARLGFDDVICTGVRWDGDRLHGALTTPNCRHRVKVERFEAWRAHHPQLRTVAYANAASDLPHLRLADRGVLVNGRAATRLLARREGIETFDWR